MAGAIASRKLVALDQREPGRRLAGARILELFGVQPVRGSSSRRGPQALREMISWVRARLRSRHHPGRPARAALRGAGGRGVLGQVTGLPVIPVSYRASRKIALHSWDQFQIPLPFSRCEIILGSQFAFHAPPRMKNAKACGSNWRKRCVRSRATIEWP